MLANVLDFHLYCGNYMYIIEIGLHFTQYLSHCCVSNQKLKLKTKRKQMTIDIKKKLFIQTFKTQ